MEYGKVDLSMVTQQLSQNYNVKSLLALSLAIIYVCMMRPSCGDKPLECCFSGPGQFFIQIR